MSNKNTIVLVLDSSAFIYNLKILQLDFTLYTISDINQELLSENAKLLFDIAIINKKLILRDPSQSSLNFIKQTSKKTGDYVNLSLIDLKIIALAWELKTKEKLEPVVFTEDYSIQNVLAKLNLKYSSFVEKGIKKQIHWIYYCPECGKYIKSPSKNLICQKCGSKLKKRPKRIKKF
ncbi:MAG: NOB1 family endonuclease [Candidatus Helarchaeota archaeon]